MNKWILRFLLAIVIFSQAFCVNAAEKFRVATYNLENYVDDPASKRPLKSEASREKICENIQALNPDVIAVEEIGSLNLLMDLRERLSKRSLEYP
ncbi:MAG TPA: hypothetical protein PLW02_07695, partial [Verrucomicrobiota bacterium]|nr:hypothetical protein [Verrucomicrobiota bacterium]